MLVDQKIHVVVVVVAVVVNKRNCSEPAKCVQTEVPVRPNVHTCPNVEVHVCALATVQTYLLHDVSQSLCMHHLWHCLSHNVTIFVKI